jgi:23S rRNA (cytosine1962-C5)-methyltransferase
MTSTEDPDDRDADDDASTQTPSEDAALKTRRPPPGPWIYRKMVRFPAAHVKNGAYVLLRDRDGAPFARGFLNRRSEIAFRRIGRPEESDVRAALRSRLREAHDLRTQTLRLHETTDAARIVHGEADGLSGLVVDRYGGTLVAQLYALGYVANAETLEAELRRLPGVKRVVFSGDLRSAELEGFDPPSPPSGLSETVSENGVSFVVDLSTGHKTGLFLDQRDNRALCARYAKGRRVLDLCTNAGGFAVSASKSGAKEVVGVDLDEKALLRARANAELNRAKATFVHADAYDDLRDRAKKGLRYDLVVLDPHKLATGKGEVEKALRSYRDLNRLAFGVAAKGALMFTFSCSGAVSETAFVAAVADAAAEAKREVRVLSNLGAAPDHPYALEFLEGRYLKGLLLHVR